MRGVIFDIQSYAIHDGPGIRTCVFFKGCPLRCAWCHNPESQSPRVEMAHRRHRCTGCGQCVEACPRGALRLEGGAARRDVERCTACGACAEACPAEAMARIGYELSAAEVARLVERDRPFHLESGGGATLTGGEPTLQAGFLFEVLGELRSRHIHTALETCGQFDPSLAARLAAAADLFLFDLKHLSDERHRQATGAGNGRILENFGAIVDLAGQDRVVVRIPVIPGFNADPAALSATAEFLAGRGWRAPVHLLAHHGWARDKYLMLGREAPRAAGEPLSPEQRERLRSIYVEHGLNPVWS